MKKLLFPAVAAMVLAAVSSSCGDKSKSAQNAADSTDVVFEEVVITETDSVAPAAVTEAEGQSIIDRLKAAASSSEEANKLAQEAKDYINKLIASGKIDQAKAYLAKVAPYIKEKAPKAYDAIQNLVSNDKLDAAKAAASDAVDKAKGAASDAADAAKDAAQAAKDKASAAKDKASDAVKDKADQVKDLFNK